MPPQEIGKILRANGLVPQATPVRNGEAYQVRAIDRRGRQMRVAIDARYGDILMVRPIVMVPPGAYGPRPYGPPPGYDDDMPTGAIGAYPPPPGAGRAAALTPAHPPIPRPKPAAKPAAATPSTPQAAPAPAASAAPPAASAPETPAPAATTSPPAAGPPAAAPSLPPVTPLE
jgi:hypothetical protein